MVKIEISPGKEIYLDENLMYQLDTLVYNVTSDWDFVIIVSGDRMVRVGKSVLAMSIGAYLAYRLKSPFSLDNIFLDSQEMINFAQTAHKHSAIIYDEGREGLAASKSGHKLQQDLLDYFAECGQLNHIFIIVLPDFFELKETMAVGRSEYLINVYRKSVELMIDMYNDGVIRPVVRFDRGQFEFFSRKKKQLLYDIAQSKHMKNYGLVKANFIGKFTNNYSIDHDAYIQKKADALKRFNEKKKEVKATKLDVFRDKEILRLRAEGLSFNKIVKELDNKWGYKTDDSAVHRYYTKLMEQQAQQAKEVEI